MVSIHRLSVTNTDAHGVALVLPGAGYTAQAPLLYWPLRALTQAGWDVWGIDWHSDIDETTFRDVQGFVEEALARADEVLPKAPQVVLAKSFGTFGLPYFAHRDVRAAWLTPILTDPVVADALANVSAGAHLGVGGTADPAWRPDLVGNTGARLVTVKDADHGLEETTAPWREASARQLGIIGKVVGHLLEY
ncbi:hypothetical protein ABS642_10840 [Microbacterium sp. A8/3-1]|uniref:Alpha/beta hydrolase n=1 Tax=Microbacterium sp. A8/3-1 TaxID=3160749 RepID=A0AAU7W1V3_9MICO